MRYVLMIHASATSTSALSKEEGAKLMQDYGQYTRDLMATGKAGDCAALEAEHTATTVQVREGKRIVKDGPYPETREQLGGYYSLDAASEEEALAWAAKIPGAKYGTIEVRPLIEHPDAGAGKDDAPPPQAEGLKDYVFLLYEAEARWAKMSEAEQRAELGGYMAFGASTAAAGKLVAGEQLDSVRKAKSVTLDGGKRVVKDGPFAEMREQLGGYYRVRARDLDDAIALAVQLPTAAAGTVEIRPVWDTSAYV
jgi:hypothetical protein